MKKYIKHDPWKIIEEGFKPGNNRISESLFSIGNGRMGQRANFEERYSGDHLQGSYVAGIYYPDKTRVGWWKNGYPEYFAKVLNAPNWIGIDVVINEKQLDLATWSILEFRRELDMKTGILSRNVLVENSGHEQVRIESRRFCSMNEGEIGAIEYKLTLVNFSGIIMITPYLDSDVANQDSNYGEKFWDRVEEKADLREGHLIASTKKSHFHIGIAMIYEIHKNGNSIDGTPEVVKNEKYISCTDSVSFDKSDQVVIHKYAAVCSSEFHKKQSLAEQCSQVVNRAYQLGYKKLLQDHTMAWSLKWDISDIVIEGDVAAQQGIRFNIFQLHQTYTGEDPGLNIGPKGFTGEKYGGTTYWDTEAYCLPFYLSAAHQNAARNLLVYRYNHLQKAIENAEKLGFSDGAALYPMVTINGEECHNEWEITFEEIHRNGAIAYAIYDYIRYTEDNAYLVECGLDVLIGISRFWEQRVNWSNEKNKYVILGVTGPNEFENNVNNNWYTNTIAVWTMEYTLKSIDRVRNEDQAAWEKIRKRVELKDGETTRWKEVIDKMYYPIDVAQNIFLQQDGFLDKDIKPVSELDPSDRPLNQNWSWDRILRSCFIKQADVLQGLYFLEDQYDMDTIRRNFDYYEPLTVHESSLSPSVHVILASLLDYREKAYELYLRTARLDLDDYNGDTKDGCHITSMAGTWMSFVKGFGGMRVRNGMLHFNPYLPRQWDSYEFRIRFRGNIVRIGVHEDTIHIMNESEKDMSVTIRDTEIRITANNSKMIPNNS